MGAEKVLSGFPDALPGIISPVIYPDLNLGVLPQPVLVGRPNLPI